MLRGRIVVAMLIRTNLLIALRDSANDGELGRTVNLLSFETGGSSPPNPTLTLKNKKKCTLTEKITMCVLWESM